MEYELLHVCRENGGILTEYWNGNQWCMRIHESEIEEDIRIYAPQALDKKEERRPWNDRDPQELLYCGRDILGEEILKKGEPKYEEIRNLLPPINRSAYCFLSGTASWGGVVVDPLGQIFPQVSGNLRQPDPIFSPVQIDDELGEQPPRQFLLAGQYPLLFSVHSSGNKVLEFLYFVEPGDPDRDPIVWIRTKWYDKEAPEHCRMEYRIAALSRHTGRKIHKETFLTALADTAVYWIKFCSSGSQLSIPENSLKKTVYGTLMACAITFSGDHAHYGHLRYGAELHDNFPPNYIWTLEACCLLGHHAWAERIWQHLLIYVLNDQGRFTYRQGEHELFGASAEEYGQLLFLANRYSCPLKVALWPEIYWQKLMGMGNVLLTNCVPCEEYEGRVLIRMCAEADTNTRIHVYLNNNLWAIRGLQALAQLLRGSGRVSEAEPYFRMAETLLKNIRVLTERYSQDSPYGPLVPFRFGYTALPYTLSTCRDTSASLNAKQLRAYLTPSEARSQGNGQDLTENTYANYRYYLEALSAMLLDKKQGDAIVALREALGGEYLGMTRFYGWLDDWPVVHYARYLLETGRISKYILLLYAHTAHHGNPELMCYYEQVSTNGEVIAPDCVPVLLTTAIMTAWMFAYETVDSCTLLLLSGIPLSWFQSEFSAEKIGYSGGTCDIRWDGRKLSLIFSAPLEKEAAVVWRLKESIAPDDILCGMEYIERLEENRIFLKKQFRRITIEIKP